MKKLTFIWAAIMLFTAVMVFPPISTNASTSSVSTDIDHTLDKELTEKNSRPVLLKYIARENKCTVSSSEAEGTATVYDKNGNAIKVYSGVSFLNGEPVVDGGLPEFDFGWTVCRHIANTDMFDNEQDAALAGALTYAGQTEALVFYVGNCYFGYYFSDIQGGHSANCNHEANSEMFFEHDVLLENGILSYEKNAQQSYNINLSGNNPQQSSILDNEIKPVLLKYIVRKNSGVMAYDEENKLTTIYDKNGQIIVRYKNVPLLHGAQATDSNVIGRSTGWESLSHEPNTDMFDKEEDAVLAGWLTYFKQSKNSSFTFYVGNCYYGYYFSLTEGEHETGCNHQSNLGMFYEKQVVIESGNLLYDDKTESINTINAYANDKSITADSPTAAMTKMVTLFNTEYDNKNGVQSSYFSLRDRVYRNYWDDVANYDVTDYVFIPAALPVIEDETIVGPEARAKHYKNQNDENAAAMANGIKSLLQYRKDAKVWIGTPGVTSLNFNVDGLNPDVLKDFVNKVRIELGNEIWIKNVAGVYINQEAIYGDNLKKQTDRFKEVIDFVKGLDKSKMALWIPYFDSNADSTEVAETIASVSVMPDLFDYIIIQPGYFFFNSIDGALDPSTTEHKKANIAAIEKSAENNYISNALGEAISGSATSQALIGIELEPQSSYFSNSRDTRGESLNRHTDYLSAGARLMGTRPIAFYTSGDPHCNRDCLVYKFYEAGDLSDTAVRKKLDDSLNEFFSYVFAGREKEKIFKDYAMHLYLNSSAGKTEEDFEAVYKADTVIVEFYKYEKAMKIEDLTEYISTGNVLPSYIDEKILKLLGVE